MEDGWRGVEGPDVRIPVGAVAALLRSDDGSVVRERCKEEKVQDLQRQTGGVDKT
jgi:hypothetical protein